MFGTTHVLAMGVQGWPLIDSWPGNLPPITLMSVLIPMLVIFLKIIQVFFTRFADCLFANPEYYNQFERSWLPPPGAVARTSSSDGEGTHQPSLTSSRSTIGHQSSLASSRSTIGNQSNESIPLVASRSHSKNRRSKSRSNKTSKKKHTHKHHRRDISLSAQDMPKLSMDTAMPLYGRHEGPYGQSLLMKDDEVV